MTSHIILPVSLSGGNSSASLLKKRKEALREERTCSVITQLSELQSWDTKPSAWFQGKLLHSSYHLPPLIANVPFAIWSNRLAESKYSAEHYLLSSWLLQYETVALVPDTPAHPCVGKQMLPGQFQFPFWSQ